MVPEHGVKLAELGGQKRIRNLAPFDCSADVSHVVALNGKRDAARPHIASIFRQRRVDALNVF
jgi:hypothetical protein